MSSIVSAKKRGRGRPEVDTVAVNVRIDRKLLDAIDVYQTENGLKSRPEAIRRILSQALDLDS